MSLFIATTDGTTTFRLDQVEVDLISIVKVDSGIEFQEDATQVIEGVTTVPVAYAQTETGPTPDRVNALVNNVGFAAPPHIVAFGVDDSFVLSDGTPLKGNGVAIPVGESGNPFTAHVATFYDVTLCGGQGVWVDKEGGGTTQESTDVILYHELSHCFHFVTGTTAPTSAQEEVNAETDENDMRDVLGYAHRDAQSHNGGCGGGPAPSCCIVASLATGSPYSREVNRFRRYRESTLRGSDVGDDFFQCLFHGYYAFSPEVVRLLGRTPELGRVVRDRYVVPLLAASELLIEYANGRGKGLSAVVRRQIDRPDTSSQLTRQSLEVLARDLRLATSALPVQQLHETWVGDDHAGSGLAPAVRELVDRVARARDDELLRWALIDNIAIWASAVLMVHEGKRDHVVDAAVAARIAEWLGRMPITSIWHSFSRLKAEEELTSLDQFHFDPRARIAFADRLATAVPSLGLTAARWAGATRETERGLDA